MEALGVTGKGDVPVVGQGPTERSALKGGAEATRGGRNGSAAANGAMPAKLAAGPSKPFPSCAIWRAFPQNKRKREEGTMTIVYTYSLGRECV